jgi:serpin B
MNETLKALGMPLAFDPGGADFSGINPQERPFISFVIHQANIDVDEKGTEAAAATAVGGDVAGPGVRPAKDITMRLDKPYLFFVRDVETGAILFMGRVTDPSVPRGT